MIDLSGDDRFKYVLLFRNHGKVAGASLEHPHSQMIALPMVPMDVKQEMRGVERFYDYHERCIYCDMIRQEQNFGRRIIEENSEFIAFEPFAPQFPFETWVLPKGHRASFIEDTREQISLFADITQRVLKRIGKALNYPPYNYTLHTAPINLERDPNPYFHWHLEIMPRLTIAAGFEMGTGVYINVTSPEDAAEHLRAVEIEAPVDESDLLKNTAIPVKIH
jgi:UDPglucose--hexose-1-phosphate uridylyltransferase